MSNDRYRFPSATRAGVTRKYQVGTVAIYLTTNCDDDGRPREIFGKADDGWTPYVEDCCIPASLALQYGCPVAVLVAKLRHRREYPPAGGPGQAKSIADAIGKELERYCETEVDGGGKKV